MAQPNSPIALATAADYADAMITARRAKSCLLVILLVMMLAQLAIFFVAKYVKDVIPNGTTVASTQESAAVDPLAEKLSPVLEYVTGIINFLGVAVVLVLGVVLLLILAIMLIGRLIGVSKVTSAFIWCVVLALILFPWQAFLNYPTLSEMPLRLPGAMYTWAELVRDVHFDHRSTAEVVLKWARFLIFPLVALFLLLVIQVKSNRGLKLALGESDPITDDLPTA
jgi:hypothetical protein